MPASVDIDSDGFIFVRRGRRSFPNNITATSNGDKSKFDSTKTRAVVAHQQSPPDSVDIEAVISRVQSLSDRLSQSQFFQRLLDSITTALRLTTATPSGSDQYRQGAPLNLLCYGLGHVATSYISQLQLALLLSLRSHFHHNQPGLDSPPVQLFDPAFWPAERQLLQRLSLHVLEVGGEAAASWHLSTRTLVYMPHCDSDLYEHLLTANWSIHQMALCLLLGNSFSRRQLHTPTSQLLTWPLLHLMAPHVHEQQVACSLAGDDELLELCRARMFETFNDTSLHCFPIDRLAALPDTFWSSPLDNVSPCVQKSAPVVDDARKMKTLSESDATQRESRRSRGKTRL